MIRFLLYQNLSLIPYSLACTIVFNLCHLYHQGLSVLFCTFYSCVLQPIKYTWQYALFTWMLARSLIQMSSNLIKFSVCFHQLSSSLSWSKTTGYAVHLFIHRMVPLLVSFILFKPLSTIVMLTIMKQTFSREMFQLEASTILRKSNYICIALPCSFLS